MTLILVLSVLSTVHGEQDAKVPRIGVLLVGFSPSAAPVQGFRQGLRELGYVEGQNILIEWRSADGRYDRVPFLVADLVHLNVAVIVADSTVAVRAAKQATATIPVVMAIVADPVGSGLVTSLSRPGGNITGLSLMMTEISAKRLQLLREIVPKASRVAVLWNPASPWHQRVVKQIELVAPALRMRPQFVAARSPADFEPAFSAMTKGHADALFVVEDPVFDFHRSRLLELVRKSRLPAIYGVRDVVEAGGLVSYGASFTDMFRRSAFFVDKLLKGAKPAELPVEQPTKLELVINLKTAKALGLTIPQSVLSQADQVIR
jgi:putative ABC transport system substrate-binding protein